MSYIDAQWFLEIHFGFYSLILSAKDFSILSAKGHYFALLKPSYYKLIYEAIPSC